MPPQRVTVSGNVHLILTDGCNLTVNGGIGVSRGNSLTIYAQPTGDSPMGSLTAQNVAEYNAGIGGSNSSSSGDITINGGDITATGNKGAGIGGSHGGSVGNITINGGDITANGGEYGAGIGGCSQSSGNITINGGVITANGTSGAGIGGGEGRDGGTIKIEGGKVNASTYDGAGIGGGRDGSGGNITISGGEITATGTSGTGIGGGFGGDGGEIIISGGNVTATGNNGAGIGGGDEKGYSGTFSTGENGSAVIYASSISDTKSQGSWRGIIFEDGNGTVYGEQTLNTDLTIASNQTLTVSKDASLTIPGNVTLTVSEGASLTNNGTIIKNGTISGTVTGKQPVVSVKYLDASGTGQTMNCVVITADYLTEHSNTLQSGWYVVKDTVTIGAEGALQRVTVSGDVHLILTDNCDLTVSGGIGVNEDNSLTIYAQSTGSDMGKLTAQKVNHLYAGIGGDENCSGGTIIINGGTVTATGGEQAAGIGGGYNGSGGTITINGGKVTANGNFGVGIGGGRNGSGGKITISGGNVTANGGDQGAGIGGSNSDSGGEIAISGNAIVNATGGQLAAGIGGSTVSSGGIITISGGTVTANGGQDGGAGIGGGAQGSGGTITISGGTVTATGNSYGAGIGGGGSNWTDGGAGGIITISGGTVTATGGSAGGAGIGSGQGENTSGDSGTFSTGENGSAVIYASSISDTSGKDNWGGLVYFPLNLTDCTASGDVTTYPEGGKLYGKAGGTIILTPGTAPEGQMLTGWQSNEVTVTDGSFTMPGKAVTVEAVFGDIVASVADGETVTDYAFFSQAFDAANHANGSTLKLLANVTEDSTFSVSNSFTLDLNGKTLTSSATGCAITVINGGSLTITDSSDAKTGAIVNTSSESEDYVVKVENGGTATIQGGVIRGRNCVYNAGTLEVKGGTLETTAFSDSGYCIVNRGTVTISDGTLENASPIFNTAEGITLTGGRFPDGISFADGSKVRSLLENDKYAFYDLNDNNTPVSVGNTSSSIVPGVVVLPHTHSFTCTIIEGDLRDTQHLATCECGYSKTEDHDFVDNNGFCKQCDACQPATENGGAYEISNAGQLFWFEDYVNKNAEPEARSAWGLLQEDITIPEKADGSKREWTPIGTEDTPYRGAFNGNGYSISGLYFAGEVQYASLFGVVEGPESRIENLTIQSVEYDVSVSRSMIAGICGVLKGGEIRNCTNLADIYSHERQGTAGICYENNGTIFGCTNTGTIRAGSDATAGGICVTNNGSISECTNTGTIHAGDSSTVGGICVINNKSISKCTNTGTIYGWIAGGICVNNGSDEHPNVSIQNCANRGKISGEHGVGGICAINYGTVLNCYHFDSLNSGSSIGGNLWDGSFSNCYYLAEQETDELVGTTAKTAAQFASGEVAYLLSVTHSTDGRVWGQTIGQQDYPVLYGKDVYRYNSCPIYSNSEQDSGTAHSLGENGNCAVCGVALEASVTVGETVTYYTSLKKAFDAASGRTATITLLRDAKIGEDEDLTIFSGNVTFQSAENHDAAAVEGPTFYTITLNRLGSAINVVDGTFNFESGILRISTEQGIHVSGGTLNFKGGTITGSTESSSIRMNDGEVNISGGTVGFVNASEGTLNINGGNVERIAVWGLGSLYISGGTVGSIDVQRGSLNIEGGTVDTLSVKGEKTSLSGGSFREIQRREGDKGVSALLKMGYAYKLPNGTWVDATNGNDTMELAGEVIQVLPIPVSIDTQPVTTTLTYGEDKSLSVKAKGDRISYQWYQVTTGEGEGLTEHPVGTSESFNLSDLNAGSYEFFCRLTCDGYVLNSNTVTVTVEKATNGWIDNPRSSNWTYGDNPNIVNGRPKAGTTEIEYSTDGGQTYSKTVPTDAGDYKIRFTVTDKNYQDLVAEKDITIDKRHLTITWGSTTSFPYDGENHQPTAEAGRVVSGDSITLVVSGAQKNVGNYTATVTGFTAVAGTKAENYCLPDNGLSQSFSITAKALTVNVRVKDKQYDGLNTATIDGTPTLDGVIEADKDNVTLVNGTPTFTSAAVGKDIPITFTDFSISGDAIGNYTLTQPTSVTASITAKPLSDSDITVTLDQTSFAYDGTEKIPNVTVQFGSTTLVEGTDYTLSGNTGTDAKVYKLTITGTGNYSGTATKDWQITSTSITPVVTIADVVYGTAPNPSVSGNPGNGAVTYAYYSDAACTTEVTPKDVGTYYVRATVAETDSYPSSTSQAVSFQITKKDLTVTAKDHTITYGEAPANNGVTYSGFVNDETADDLGGTLAYDYSYSQYGNVGNSYTITPAGLSSDNYNIIFAAGTLTVQKKEITITGTTVAASKVYDGNTTAQITFNGNLSANFDGDNLTIVRGSAAYGSKNVGDNKEVTFSGFALGGSAAGNYTLTAQPASVTANITAKPVTLVITVADKAFDGTTDGVNFVTKLTEENAFLEGDKVEVVNGEAAFAQSTPGNGIAVTFTPFTLTGDDAGNYSITNPQPENVTGNIKPSSRYLDLDGNTAFDNQTEVWVDGVAYPVKTVNGTYVALPEDGDLLTVYTYQKNTSDLTHDNYPTGMAVYRITRTENGATVENISAFSDLLQYSGSSIRITGKRGIRMITSLTKGNKSALTGSGLAGYTLEEYGTVVQWADDLHGASLTLANGKHNYAYKKGVADPVFNTTGDLTQYTNVLVWDSLTNEQLGQDIVMRPYIILKDGSGNTVTLYGGTVSRSIGYIAYQNRTVFSPGAAAYKYVWDIIHAVYGTQYDSDYKG